MFTIRRGLCVIVGPKFKTIKKEKQMIKTSKELDELMDKIFDCYYRVNDVISESIDELLKNVAFCIVCTDDGAERCMERGVELCQEMTKQNRPAYVCFSGYYYLRYFVGDLEQDILPKLNRELKKLERIAAEKLLEEKIRHTEEKLKDLKKQKAAK